MRSSRSACKLGREDLSAQFKWEALIEESGIQCWCGHDCSIVFCLSVVLRMLVRTGEENQ